MIAGIKNGVSAMSLKKNLAIILNPHLCRLVSDIKF
jgi:hypothetical protein